MFTFVYKTGNFFVLVYCLFDFVEKPGLMDLGPDDVMMLPPPLFSLKDVPENIV